MSRAWDPHNPTKCIHIVPGIVSFSIVGVLSDFSLIMIVLPRVISLPVSRFQKISLLVVVNLGWAAIGVSILRIVKIIALQGDPDITWDALGYVIWTGVDSTIGLICAAATTLKPLVRKLPGTWLTNISSRLSERQQSTVYWNPQPVDTEEKRSERSSEGNLESGIEMEDCSAAGGTELARSRVAGHLAV
jgi:hypothetical protein